MKEKECRNIAVKGNQGNQDKNVNQKENNTPGQRPDQEIDTHNREYEITDITKT